MKLPPVALYAAIIVIEIFSICGCQTIIEEPVIPEQPKRLKASFEGFFGPSRHIIQNGKNSIIYTRNSDGFTGMPGAKKSEVHVTNQQWIEFRKDLDQANVWDWEETYDNWEIVDGGSWMLEVEYSDRLLEARGNNAYPEEGYEIFVEAVQKLVKDRDW